MHCLSIRRKAVRGMMAVIMTVFEASGLTAPEKTATMLLRTSHQALWTSPLVAEAVGQRE